MYYTRYRRKLIYKPEKTSFVVGVRLNYTDWNQDDDPDGVGRVDPEPGFSHRRELVFSSFRKPDSIEGRSEEYYTYHGIEKRDNNCLRDRYGIE